jgi:hypothetical protein
MGGVPAILLTHHYTKSGLFDRPLRRRVSAAREGLRIFFANLAGHEAQDRALVLAIVASFAEALGRK